MQNQQTINQLKVFAANIRLETLKIIASIKAGHVGGCMSIADAIAVLYGEVLNIDPKDPRKKDRDWCVLSKGHAGPVLYAALGLKGYFPMEEAIRERALKSGSFAPTLRSSIRSLQCSLAMV